MNLPNLLSLSRILLTPIFCICFATSHRQAEGAEVGMLWTLLAVFLLALAFEVTDLLDGFLARRWQQTTNLGKVIDPLADSFARFSVFLCFLWAGYAELWMVLVIFWRDIVIRARAPYCKLGSAVSSSFLPGLSPRKSSKHQDVVGSIGH